MTWPYLMLFTINLGLKEQCLRLMSKVKIYKIKLNKQEMSSSSYHSNQLALVQLYDNMFYYV